MTRNKLVEIMRNHDKGLMPGSLKIAIADHILVALEEERKGEIWCGVFDGKVLRLADSRYKDIMRAKVPGKLIFRPDNASK